MILNLSSVTGEAEHKFPASLELNGIAYDSTKESIYITGKCGLTFMKLVFRNSQDLPQRFVSAVIYMLFQPLSASC